jgi:two-component system, sensor histidine kinase
VRTSPIQVRMLLASLLPVSLISIMLAAAFLFARIGDNDLANSRRARSVARQVAVASEYGLFSANVDNLQAVAKGVLREPDVHSVVIMDGLGHVLATAGRPAYAAAPVGTGQEQKSIDPVTGMDLLLQPVVAGQIEIDHLFQDTPTAAPQQTRLLGHVLMEFSKDAALQRQHEMLLVGLGLTLTGLLLGGLLAIRLGRRVMAPVDRVSGMIARLGQGDLSARLSLRSDDPLVDVSRGLNDMAERLESSRDQLEQRVGAATQALLEKKEEAENATLAKSRFLAAASHDLRQPTHALGIFVSRLRKLPHPPETSELIENLASAVLWLQDLLDALLDLSRLDTGTMQVEIRAIALAEMFAQLRAELSVLAAEKGIRFRIRQTDAMVLSDWALLHRILSNLIGNSVRYTDKGGVLLGCRRSADGKHVRIEIWDTGIGIAPEHHKAIFTEFYQVGNAERARDKGLGLGLAIVARSARLLGHRLQMKSQLGVGTRISIEIPVAPPEAALESRAMPWDEAKDNLRGSHVMVIEDVALAREALVSLLISWGAAAVGAENLSKARLLLDEGVKPDIIISDYRLSNNENGIDAIAALRTAARRQVPACLISGDTDPGLSQAAKRAELSLLHKPVRPAKLRSLLRRLLPNSQVSNNLADGAD